MSRPLKFLAAPLLLSLATGCSSPDWTRSIIDDGGSDNVGRNPSMALRIKGSTQTMTVAYEGQAEHSVELATRSGNALGWGPFDTEQIRRNGARMPEIAQAPDGAIYVAHVIGGIPNQSTGSVALASKSGFGTPCDPDPTNTWTCETLYSGIQVADRLAAVYEPRAGLPDRIHVIWSVHGSDALWHAFRTTDNPNWFKLRVGANTSSPQYEARTGTRPVAMLGASGNLVAFYIANTPQYPPDRPVRSIGFGDYSAWASADYSKFKARSEPYAALLNDDPALATLDTYWYARGQCTEGTLRIYSNDSLQASAGTGSLAPFIAPVNIDACDPDMAMDDNGFVYAVTYRTRMGGLDIYRYNAALGAWPGSFYTIIDNSAAEVGLGPRVAYSPLTGELLVTYYNKTNGRLKLATRKVN